MKVTKKNINHILNGLVDAMPALPFVMKRRRTMASSYIFGAIGFAIAGGLATMLILSPRTRTRALSAAKGTYGKLNEKLRQQRENALRALNDVPMSNGLVDREEYSTSRGL
jgi:hypothetical protein